MLEKGALTSSIFYGPPGTGKTTLALLAAKITGSSMEKLNAVSAGVKDVRQVIKKARERRQFNGKKTLLFLDEVHRFNKSQQDTLLPALESGLITLIGATTENPYFYLNPPLLSRSLIFPFYNLQEEDLRILIKRALHDPLRGFGNLKIHLTEEALLFIINASGGDARAALNILEICVLSLRSQLDDNISNSTIGLEQVKNIVQKKYFNYDAHGDNHYDTASAFIKSIRGSDPDAALYWLAKMLHAGEDPAFIIRRLLILAAEDIGTADPRALLVAQAAASSFQMVGMPEGKIILSMATVYLATAPKSNAAYLALEKAMKEVAKEPNKQVPPHLKDASYAGAKELGFGEGYLYPHDYPGHFVPQHYWPEGMTGKEFYKPSTEGEERIIKERLESWKKQHPKD
ncbi:MAG: replication-associated recombination protein A [Firmicutes bacterium]|nr:replication-associated recombination protein A [Bacillota bacterium]